MASALGNFKEWERIIMTQMKEFPHLLNLEAPFLTQERLQCLLEALNEEYDDDDICPEETIFKLNFKSWVYIRLADRTGAEQTNNTVISMTGWTNIMSIGNCVFLNWRAGKEIEALRCLSKLQDMKQLPWFNERMATATVELAYCYSRIGGPSNTFKAINLLENIVDKYPYNFFWKLRLGLEYRRSTHLNIYLELPKMRTILEYLKLSVTMLTDVVENSSDNKLRGPALSDLAIVCRNCVYFVSNKEQHARIFNNKTPNQLCDDALKYAGDSTWVLTNCGKILRTAKDFDRAIEILQICLSLRKHTTTFHHLGLCYMDKAKLEAEVKTNGQLSVPQKYVTTQKGAANPGNFAKNGRKKIYIRPYKHNDYYPADCTRQLALPNENFDKAEYNFLEAIKMSHNHNLPAMLELGLLYKLAGLDDKALTMFNQIINTGGEGHIMTIITAYEQSGLCYLNMTGNEELAEEKLAKAISLAVKAAQSCPQLQDCVTDVWLAFRTMEDRLEAGHPSIAKDKKLIKLFNLVKNHKKVVTVVERILDMSESELNDIEVIIDGISGYLKLNEPEKALTFLNMLRIRPDITSSESWRSQAMIDLKYKVLLLAVRNRLQVQSGEGRTIFQELFKLHYGECLSDISEETPNISNTGDVLIFYDDYLDTEEELCQTSKIAHNLQNVLSQVFGISCSTNLQGCLEYGPKLSVQLEEMKRYQVVIVVLGEEQRNCEFQELLEMIPFMKVTYPPSQTVLVIDSCHDRAGIPDVLKHYRSFRLQETVNGLYQIIRGSQAGRDHHTVDDIIRNVFNGDIDALMRLFCFIVKQNWPCDVEVH